LLLKAFDLLAHGTVCQVEPVGCGAQILQFGNGSEGGQGIQRQAHGGLSGEKSIRLA
jgi:hypothetical protein